MCYVSLQTLSLRRKRGFKQHWGSDCIFRSVQEQRAGPSEAQSQAAEEKRLTGLRLSVQLVLLLRAHRPPGPVWAQVGLWKTPGLMMTPHCCRAAGKKRPVILKEGTEPSLRPRHSVGADQTKICLDNWVFLSDYVDLYFSLSEKDSYY